MQVKSISLKITRSTTTVLYLKNIPEKNKVRVGVGSLSEDTYIPPEPGLNGYLQHPTPPSFKSSLWTNVLDASGASG